jgi:hypothetical protein
LNTTGRTFVTIETPSNFSFVRESIIFYVGFILSPPKGSKPVTNTFIKYDLLFKFYVLSFATLKHRLAALHPAPHPTVSPHDIWIKEFPLLSYTKSGQESAHYSY